MRIEFEAAKHWIAERLPPGMKRDYALAKLIAHVKDDDLAAARRWAAEFSDTEFRARVLAELDAK